MKFSKRLKQQIEQSLPEWRHEFLSYKELKKLVKLISSNRSLIEFGNNNHNNRAEAEFVCLLNDEIDKFNAFFMEQEEDFIIRHKELQRIIKEVMNKWGSNGTNPSEFQYREEMGKIRKEMVDFHGEMVLLMNYSIINYTGVAKILKKYDKRTGGVLRLPFIQRVMEQPFFKTDLVISKLVRECGTTIDTVLPPPSPSESAGPLRSETVVPGEGIFRNTVAALLSMQEMRRGSSTLSHFSLPPLNLPDFEAIQSLQVQIL